jgi:hypothetical protein
MEAFQIGDVVERMGSEKDYTTGRVGVIIQIETIAKQGIRAATGRARVSWMKDKDGDPLKPQVRTWVNFRFLKPRNGQP